MLSIHVKENLVFWSIIVAPPSLIVCCSFSTPSSIVKCNSGNLKPNGVAWPSKARRLSPTSTSFPTVPQNRKQTKCKRDVSAGRGPLIVIIVDRAKSDRGGHNKYYQNKTLPSNPFPRPCPIAVVSANVRLFKSKDTGRLRWSSRWTLPRDPPGSRVQLKNKHQ